MTAITKRSEVGSSDIVPTGSGGIEAITRGELDVQITTAKAYPRDINQSVDTATALATIDADTAASCFYNIERGGKVITGPSIRCAEIVAASWGNLRFGGRVVEIGNKFVTCQGMAYDLERNVAAHTEVARRITDKHGRRYNDDMIQVTTAACISIATRNALMRAIPKAVISKVEQAARAASVSGPRPSLWETIVAGFAKWDVLEGQLLNKVDRETADDVTDADMERLIGIGTAIREGHSTIAQEFHGAEPVEDVTNDDVAKRVDEFARQFAGTAESEKVG